MHVCFSVFEVTLFSSSCHFVTLGGNCLGLLVVVCPSVSPLFMSLVCVNLAFVCVHFVSLCFCVSL